MQREGRVAESEMQRVFNCGIGMVVVVHREQVAVALRLLQEAGEQAVEIGVIESRQGLEERVIVF